MADIISHSFTRLQSGHYLDASFTTQGSVAVVVASPAGELHSATQHISILQREGECAGFDRNDFARRVCSALAGSESTGSVTIAASPLPSSNHPPPLLLEVRLLSASPATGKMQGYVLAARLPLKAGMGALRPGRLPVPGPAPAEPSSGDWILLLERLYQQTMRLRMTAQKRTEQAQALRRQLEEMQAEQRRQQQLGNDRGSLPSTGPPPLSLAAPYPPAPDPALAAPPSPALERPLQPLCQQQQQPADQAPDPSLSLSLDLSLPAAPRSAPQHQLHPARQEREEEEQEQLQEDLPGSHMSSFSLSFGAASASSPAHAHAHSGAAIRHPQGPRPASGLDPHSALTIGGDAEGKGQEAAAAAGAGVEAASEASSHGRRRRRRERLFDEPELEPEPRGPTRAAAAGAAGMRRAESVQEVPDSLAPPTHAPVPFPVQAPSRSRLGAPGPASSGAADSADDVFSRHERRLEEIKREARRAAAQGPARRPAAASGSGRKRTHDEEQQGQLKRARLG